MHKLIKFMVLLVALIYLIFKLTGMSISCYLGTRHGWGRATNLC